MTSQFRKIGWIISLWIIDTVHTLRYWLSLSTRNIQGSRIIIEQNGKVLLVSHWYAPWAWTLPGGGIHKNEDPEAAAIRGALEETGLIVKSIEGEVGIYKGRWGWGDRIAVYFSTNFEGSLSIKPNLEIMSRSWFDMDNLPEETSPANRRRIDSYRNGARGERGEWY